MIGADVQWSELSGDLIYPNPDKMNNNYFSFLPSFNMRYSLDRTNSIHAVILSHTQWLALSIQSDKDSVKLLQNFLKALLINKQNIINQ